jgi:NitT/TauT family transport system ATP-binding protein
MRLQELLLTIWNERPTTVLFITHNLNEALFLADRILFMSPGPGRIVHDYMVPLARPRTTLTSDEIYGLRQSLLKDHPDLLTGLIGGAEAEQKES